MICLILVASVTSTNCPSPLQAENWPQWRGPSSNGISTEEGIPVEWDRSDNVDWRLPMPGPAGSTPVVWGERVFVTSVDGEELVLLCIGTDGKQRWRRVVGRGNKNVRRDEGNTASNSPVTDGELVWSMMANGAIGCYDMQGKEVWKMNLQDRYGDFKIQFGMTSTPTLYGDLLYFQLIHGDYKGETKEAMVVALDKRTGKEVWKHDRQSDAYGENEHSYASPIVYDDGKLKLLITHGGDYTIAHDLADGHEVWRCGGLNPHDDPRKEYHRTLRFVASPAAVPGMIVIPTAKNSRVVAIRPDLSGDITDDDQAHIWTRPENTPDVPSPLIHDGLVYLCRENGNLICMEADTGDELYQKRTTRDRHRASPVFADGHVYLTARNGRVTVVRAGRDFEIVAVNDLEEPTTSSPAISNGTIYIRTFEALWAIRE
jgi:outer membrane protein assembly factor BamB